MIAVVTEHLLHRHIYMVANPGRFRAAILVHDREFVAISKVDERLAVARQMQIDSAMHVVVVRFRRRVRIGEPKAARVWDEHAGVIAGVTTLSAIRSRPVGLFELTCIRIVEPSVSI